jgi:hypothetical protein
MTRPRCADDRRLDHLNAKTLREFSALPRRLHKYFSIALGRRGSSPLDQRMRG